jgi:GNAT superfamily N-acetyltransferase
MCGLPINRLDTVSPTGVQICRLRQAAVAKISVCKMFTLVKTPTTAAEQRPTGFGLTVRSAEMADSSVLAELMGELGYPTRTSEMEQRLELIMREPHYRTFVAVLDGTVCGMIGTCCLQSHEHNNVGGRIIALVVSEKQRGRGVGRALVQAAESDFIARNIRRIALNTRLTREKAHQFYDGLGYIKNGFRFVKELEGLAD